MARIVFVNGEKVSVNALEITDNKGEELDFGVFHIPFSTVKENYQLGSTVKIFINDGTNTLEYDEMIIVSDIVTKISRITDIYSHTVTFIESIKQYEKILGANIAITQPIGGIKLSLLDVINKIRDKVPYERTSLFSSTRLFTVDDDEATYLNSIDAPQFFFNRLSIREMLNSVGAYVNGIARMTDGNILIYSLYNILLTNILDIGENVLSDILDANYQNFGTTIDVDVQNVIMSDDIARGKVTFPSKNSWITPRATKLKLEDTQYEFRMFGKLEEVNTVDIKVRTDLNNPNELTELDISTQVYEKATWDRLSLDATVPTQRALNNYKSNTLYWQYSGNTISNNDLFGIGGAFNTMESVVKRALEKEQTNAQYAYPPVNETSPGLDEFLMRVQYIPYINTKLRQQKSNITDVATNLHILSNQGGRIISGERLMKNIHGLVERLGNDERSIKKFGTELSELHINGDYFKDNGTFILSKRKIVYDRYDYVVNYDFSKNFNRLSQRIQIDQEDRQFDIPLGKEQVNRHEIYEEFVELNIVGEDNESLITPSGIETFMNTFKSTRSTTGNRPAPGTGLNKSCDVVVIRSVDMIEPIIKQTPAGIYKHLTKIGEGTGLAFSWELDDVIKAGSRLTKDFFLDGLSTIELDVNQNVFYTDENGELDTIELSYHSEIDILDNTNANSLPFAIPPSYPLIGGHGRNTLEANDSFKIVKDRAETIGMTYMIQVVPYSQLAETLIIGNKAIKNNNMLFELSNTESLYIWTSNTETYNGSTDNEKVKGTRQDAIPYDVILTGSTHDNWQAKIITNPLLTNGMASWGLADSNGKLLLGVNQTDINISTVFFNFKNKRSNLNYKFDGIPINPDNKPIAPSNLDLSLATYDSIQGVWNDNSPNEDGFVVELSKDIDFLPLEDTVTLNPNDNSHTFINLDPLTLYYYRVKAFNIYGNSDWVDNNISTTATPTPPIAPNNLLSVSNTDERINLTWDDNSVNETSYVVEVSTDGGSVWILNNTLSFNATSGPAINLVSNTLYDIRVGAKNDLFTTYSNVIQVTTDAQVSTSPSFVSINFDDVNDTVTFSAIDNSFNELGFRFYADGILDFDDATSKSGTGLPWVHTQFNARSYFGTGNVTLGLSSYNNDSETDWNDCKGTIEITALAGQLAQPLGFIQDIAQEGPGFSVYVTSFNSDYGSTVDIKYWFEGATKQTYAGLLPRTATWDGIDEGQWQLMTQQLASGESRDVHFQAIDPDGIRPDSDIYTLVATAP